MDSISFMEGLFLKSSLFSGAQIGATFALLSATFLALAVAVDKLLLGDLYEGIPSGAWMVSSGLGAVLGMVTTLVVGAIGFGVGWGAELSQIVSGPEREAAFIVLLAGVLSAVTLRVYFELFTCHSQTSVIALAITITPVFVFAAEMVLARDGWTLAAFASVILAVSGVAGFEYVSRDDDDEEGSGASLGLVWLTLFILLSTIYIVFADYGVERFSEGSQRSLLPATIVVMPFYWLGFSIGGWQLLSPGGMRVAKRIIAKSRLIVVVLAMECLGFAFYFCELLGFAYLSATNTVLLTGLNVFVAWGFDLLYQSRVRHAQLQGLDAIAFLGFSIQEGFDGDTDPKVRIGAKLAFLTIAIGGVLLWPGA